MSSKTTLNEFIAILKKYNCPPNQYGLGGWMQATVAMREELERQRKRAELAEEKLILARKALGATLLFREFMDEWHDMGNPDVVEFRRLREEFYS